MKTLEAFGWRWRDNGADVYVTLGGRTYQVFVPISAIHISFGNAFAAAGTPFEPTVGAPTVSGLFSSISKAVSKVGRAAKSIVKKGVRSVKKVAKGTVRRVASGARGVLSSGYSGLRQLSRGNITGALGQGLRGGFSALDMADPTGLSRRIASHPLVRQGMVAASAAFPMTAPFAPAIAAANKAYADFQRGQRAASRIASGERSPHLLGAIQRGMQAREGVAQMARLAASRDPRAMQVMGAFSQLGSGTLPGAWS
jgi:hypothetical protein